METPTMEMRVKKRDGTLKTIEFDKILRRIKTLGNYDVQRLVINYTALTMKVIDQIYDGISTAKIDELSAEQCMAMSSLHPDYSTLAGRIVVSNHQKNTKNSFSEVMSDLYNFKDKHGKQSPLVSDDLYNLVRERSAELDAMCDYSRDYLIDYFGFKTLDRSYLMKVNGKSMERPQHMWLRVSVGIHGQNMEAIKETYDYMSRKYMTHATPTLFNAGTPHPQLSSCFLQAMESDSIDGIYNTLKDCALISKWAGGIGLHIHNVRASGSHIRGTNGNSNGIVPMLKVFNNTAKYVDQCVHPLTKIYTVDGTKEIQCCVANQTQIYNMAGGTETIQNVLEHDYDGEFLHIASETGDVLRITPQHPVYAIRSGTDEPDWIDAGELRAGDYIVHSVPTWTQDVATISAMDCYMLGVGEAYGFPLRPPSLTDDIHSRELADEVAKYLDEKLIQWREPDKGRVGKGTTPTASDAPLAQTVGSLHSPFRRSDFFDDAGRPQIQARWMNLPIEKSKHILRGMYRKNTQFDDELTFPTEYGEDVRMLCLRLGVIVRVEHDRVIIPRTREICDLLGEEYQGFVPPKMPICAVITDIQTTEYRGLLYDLQMKDEHNYMLTSGLVHNGGGKRNGSFAIYLEPWHADIELFLQMRKNHGDEELKARDLFYAIWMPDLFMDRVKASGKWTLMCPDECPGLADVYGDEFVALYEKYEAEGKGRRTAEARDIWFQILDAQMETGTPYLLFKDACNKKSNQKNLGTIKSSNLCVAPETLVLTNKGHVEIQTMEGQTVSVWNGEEFSDVEIVKTGTDQEMIDVFTDDGSKLTCTPYHKFYIQNTYSANSIQMIEAHNLKSGDKLLKCDYPVIDGTDTFMYAYTHGFFCGDGTYGNIYETEERPCCFASLEGHHFCKRHLDYETDKYLSDTNKEINGIGRCQAQSYAKKATTYLYGEKKDLLKYMKYRSYTESGGRLVLQLPVDISEKFFIPSFNCSLKYKLDWFAGYCDADGTIPRNGENEQLQVGSINYEFLQHVKLLLQTCGINPKIRLSKDKGQSLLPDGKGGHKYFETQPLYRLLITSCDLFVLYENGFRPNRLKVTGNKPARDAKQFIKILKVENNNRVDDTYCFTEPKRHMGVFNGILTGQCSEIVQYSDANETAVCNLASIALPTFVSADGIMDYDELHKVAKILTSNLNKVIDINYYPIEKTRVSNLRHRPVGIGVQGVSCVFMKMNVPFDSDIARDTNKKIFETIYHAALERSCELAERDGAYETFAGSPASRGELQFDLWGVNPGTDRYNWPELKQRIIKHGIRNSLLLAPMPTASTSQILGFNECFEPITSNIYNRRTIAGEFMMTNKYLMNDLLKLGLWNEKIKNNIIANNGSVQHIEAIPKEVRDKYKTVWEMSMKCLIDMSADRGAFICQSQSLNLWLEEPNYNTLTSMHFYSWSKGLKTGIYYLRRRARHQAQQFTIEPTQAECVMCGS